MDTRLSKVGTIGLAAALVASLCPLSALSSDAYAVTAAEKQAEADAVYAQIDLLQTSLNEAEAEYYRATNAYEEAIDLRDEAQRQIKEETERIDTLQDDLTMFAVSMYKKGGTGSFRKLPHILGCVHGHLEIRNRADRS